MFYKLSEIHNLLVDEFSTLQDVIINLNLNEMKIVVVVDTNKKLVGVICDGDIRRGLIKGLNLNSTAKEITSLSPNFIYEDTKEHEINKLLFKYKINQLPVVNNDNILVGLFIKDHSFLSNEKLKSNTVVIMAGGKGLRLKPFTSNIPKPLVKIGEKSILEHIISNVRKDGFINIIIAINHMGEMIEDIIGDGSHLNVNVSYLRENSFLGTAGALSLLEKGANDPIIVINGDILTEVNFFNLLEYHTDNKSDATMAVTEYELINPYGVVIIDGHNITGFKEKPTIKNYINAGIYVLSCHTLDLLKANEYCDMPDLFTKIRQSKLKTIAYAIHESWLDIGSPKDLLEANNKHDIKYEKN